MNTLNSVSKNYGAKTKATQRRILETHPNSLCNFRFFELAGIGVPTHYRDLIIRFLLPICPASIFPVACSACATRKSNGHMPSWSRGEREGAEGFRQFVALRFRLFRPLITGSFQPVPLTGLGLA